MGFPHVWQNFTVSGLEAWHAGQTRAPGGREGGILVGAVVPGGTGPGTPGVWAMALRCIASFIRASIMARASGGIRAIISGFIAIIPAPPIDGMKLDTFTLLTAKPAASRVLRMDPSRVGIWAEIEEASAPSTTPLRRGTTIGPIACSGFWERPRVGPAGDWTSFAGSAKANRISAKREIEEPDLLRPECSILMF